MEGFCAPLFLEALGGLCAPNLERLEWSFLHRSRSLVATTKKTLPIKLIMPLNSEVLKRP